MAIIKKSQGFRDISLSFKRHPVTNDIAALKDTDAIKRSVRNLVQTIPNKLPELLINLSSQGPHLMGATLSTLLRAVHPGTIAMTDFRQRPRPKVFTRHLGDLGTLHVISCSDEHIVLGIRHYGSIPLILKGRTLVATGPSAYGSSPGQCIRR